MGDEDRELEVDINKQSDSQSTFRQRRARLETFVLFVASAVVVAATAYALSWSTTGAATSESPDEAPTLRPTQPSATSTASPDGTALALGETFEGSRASSTVRAVEVLDAPDELAAPDGEAWVGLRIKRCASETQSSAKAPYARWVVVDEQGETYPGDSSAPKGLVAKRLTTADFPAGQCRSGWVVIGVPEAASETIAAVRFVPPAGKSAEWTVPAA